MTKSVTAIWSLVLAMGMIISSVSAESPKDQVMLLEEYGNDLVYVNSRPRTGNRYGIKDEWESWEPNFNFSIIPVQLKKGENDFLFYVSRGRLKAKLTKAEAAASFNIKDPTLPDFLVGEAVDTRGAVIVINSSQVPLKSFSIESKTGDNDPVRTDIPVIQPMTIRNAKQPFICGMVI